MNIESEHLVRVCSTNELPPGSVTRVDTKPAVAVFNVDGEFYATADLCTHDKSSLSDEGYIDNGEIECGWHFAKFCIKTGAVLTPPASKPLTKYEVQVHDGDIYVAITSP